MAEGPLRKWLKGDETPSGKPQHDIMIRVKGVKEYDTDMLKSSQLPKIEKKFDLTIQEVTHEYSETAHIYLEKILTRDGGPTYPLNLQSLQNYVDWLDENYHLDVQEVMFNFGEEEALQAFQTRDRKEELRERNIDRGR